MKERLTEYGRRAAIRRWHKGDEFADIATSYSVEYVEQLRELLRATGHRVHEIPPPGRRTYIPPTTYTKRRCLACRTEFDSEWAGNRICRRCKDTDSWRMLA